MPIKFRDLEKMLRAAGYTFGHATGSYYIYTHPNKGRVTAPFHGANVELKPGTLNAVLKQMGLK